MKTKSTLKIEFTSNEIEYFSQIMDYAICKINEECKNKLYCDDMVTLAHQLQITANKHRAGTGE